MAQQEDIAGKLESNVKSVPSKTVDTLTLGPQRREASQYISDEANKAKSFLKDQWNQAKEILGPAEKAPPAPTGPKAAKPNTFKDGGVVQKTGLALVHKGEEVKPVAKDKDGKETVHLSHHRVVMHLHKGGLHRALGIPEGQKIPASKVEAATHSKNAHVAKMANLAKTMESWHH